MYDVTLRLSEPSVRFEPGFVEPAFAGLLARRVPTTEMLRAVSRMAKDNSRIKCFRRLSWFLPDSMVKEAQHLINK